MADIRPNVLIVDDVEANLVALEALLSGMDCNLVRANNGNDALSQLLKREFAVMLLDVQMPGMDGYEVATYARENPTTETVPIIFLTAMHGTEDSVLRGYGSGAVDYLMKPITPHILRAKVRVFLELYVNQRRLSDQIEAHRKTLLALEQANTALRHFTNAASHDLRAPLRAMRGFLEVLSQQVDGSLDEKGRDYLRRSRRASERMESLLNALLVYAGLQKQVAHVEVDCDALIEQVTADLADRIAEAHATVTAEKLPRVLGSADRLYQLLLNLISNALKFRREGGDCCINVRVDGNANRPNQSVFLVEDNGIGIQLDDQKMIFDPFQRVYAHSQYEGSGLGLTICRQIVEQHNGMLWVESKPGEGSRFYFSLRRFQPKSAH